MDIAARYDQLAELAEAARRKAFWQLTAIVVVGLVFLAGGLWHLCLTN
jgi:hypothetical protein